MDDPFEHEVILVRRGEKIGEDSRGNDIFAPDSRAPQKAFLEVREGGENTDARQQVTFGYMVTLPPDVDVSAVDAVEYGGVEYEIVGEPGRQPGALGMEGFIRFAIEKVAG